MKIETLLPDKKLNKYRGVISIDNSKQEADALIESIKKECRFHYDDIFLWTFCNSSEHTQKTIQYILDNFEHFKGVLDSGFFKSLVSHNNFESRLWEMFLCDALAKYGEIISKNAAGADIMLKTSSEMIQFEATLLDESQDKDLRARKPNPNLKYDSEGGNLLDLENPVLLRFLHGFDKKAQKSTYKKDLPLIIAINTSKAVGFTSLDDYIVRKALFGLGCITLTRKTDGSFDKGLRSEMEIQKNGDSFIGGRFLDKKFNHVSGVLYSSQPPHNLLPHGYAWYNSPLTFIKNPNAINKVDIDITIANKVILEGSKYWEEVAQEKYTSIITKKNKLYIK